MVAVGIIGLNYHLFKDEIISPAHAVESQMDKNQFEDYSGAAGMTMKVLC